MTQDIRPICQTETVDLPGPFVGLPAEGAPGYKSSLRLYGVKWALVVDASMLDIEKNSESWEKVLHVRVGSAESLWAIKVLKCTGAGYVDREKYVKAAMIYHESKLISVMMATASQRDKKIDSWSIWNSKADDVHHMPILNALKLMGCEEAVQTSLPLSYKE